MAKPKKSVIVEVVVEGRVLRVWASDLTTEEILAVDGIAQILSSDKLPWRLLIDARYDINEVMADLEKFLISISKVPDDSPD